MIIVVTRKFLIADLFHTLQFQTSNMKLTLSIICLSLCLLAAVEARWYVESERAFTATQQNAFIRIVENALRKSDNTIDIAKEIQTECEKEWPSTSQTWFVVYLPNSNAGWGVNCSPHQKIYIQNHEGDDVYAARL